MTLKPADGRSLVQFIQPDRGLVSPEFPADLTVEIASVVDLRSHHTPIPGCSIEFSDTTMLPGRFQIRIGHTLFDVMQRGIIVAGKEHDWRQE